MESFHEHYMGCAPYHCTLQRCARRPGPCRFGIKCLTSSADKTTSTLEESRTIEDQGRSYGMSRNSRGIPLWDTGAASRRSVAWTSSGELALSARGTCQSPPRAYPAT